MTRKLTQKQIDVLNYLASCGGQAYLIASTQPDRQVLGVPVKPGSHPHSMTVVKLRDAGLIERPGRRTESTRRTTRAVWRITDAGCDAAGITKIHHDPKAGKATIVAGPDAVKSEAVNPVLADEADEVAAAEAKAKTDDAQATSLLTTVLTVLNAKLEASEAVCADLAIGMELDSDGQVNWFAKCQVRGRQLRSGRFEWSLAYGIGATISEAVTALGDDVEDWVAMFKVDAKLAEQRKAARKAARK